MKQQRIEVLLELISCNQPLFYWRYDEQGNLLYSDCPAEKMLDVVLRPVTVYHASSSPFSI